jgi:hypothetical protein
MLSSRSILVGVAKAPAESLADRDRGRKRDLSSCPYSPTCRVDVSVLKNSMRRPTP